MQQKGPEHRYTRLKYTLAGALFGVCFPLVAWLIDLIHHGLPWTLSSLAQMHSSNPIHWIVDTAPLVLGSIASFLGKSAQEVQRINASLEQRVSERTQALQLALDENQAQKAHLETAKQQAEAALAVRSQFLSAMSHELRTPMISILGWLDLLDKDNLRPEQADSLETIRRSARSLLGVISDVLDFSTGDSGQIKVRNNSFNPTEVSREIWDLMYPTAVTQGIRLELQVTENLEGKYFYGDPAHIRKALKNLLGNALKFTHQGSIFMRCQLRADTLRFEVEDTGIGICQAVQDQIFDAFTQADASSRRRYGGTGLGLTVARQLVDAMGGQLQMLSEKDEGSVFWFDLPARPAPAPPPELLDRSPTPPSRQGLQILLAEDNPINAEVIMAQLEELGVNIEWVENGEEVLEIVQERSFDLIFMDHHMPKKDGVEAAKEIRALDSAVSLIPIVALSASIVEEERQACADAGMNGFLGKPVTQERLQWALGHYGPPPANDDA